MNVLLLNTEQAQVVAGRYGPIHELDPRDIGSGRFILPVTVIGAPEYDAAQETLAGCPVVDYASLGVEE